MAARRPPSGSPRERGESLSVARIEQAVGELARVMRERFAQPEYIPGCEVLDITDRGEYGADNGWIEAFCAQHNRQRVRYKGIPPGVEVGDYVDVEFFPNHKLFEVRGGGYTSGNDFSGVKVFKLWQPDGSDVVAEANDADLDLLLHGGLDFDADGADHSITAAGTSDLLFATAGGTIIFDASGDLAIPSDLTISGASKKIVGTGSNVPDIGSTTAAEQFGNIYLASGKDIYPGADEAGMFQRNVDMFQTGLTTHFDTFTGWTWAAYAGFVTPGNIDSSITPSVVKVINTATEGAGRAFAYRSSYGSDIFARLVHGTTDVRTGLRMDDGTNNNYFELWITPTSGLMTLYYRKAIGGVVTGPTQLWSSNAYPAQFVVLRLVRSGDSVLFYYGVNSPVLIFLGLQAVTGWTPTRSGIYHEHTSGSFSGDRASLFDWYKQ